MKNVALCVRRLLDSFLSWFPVRIAPDVNKSVIAVLQSWVKGIGQYSRTLVGEMASFGSLHISRPTGGQDFSE